jgi:fructosamine-3-kinase
MTMFGGFGPSFWNEYHKHIPKEKGFEARHELYQLYHYLNHYNIFGSGYKGSCLRIIKNLLKYHEKHIAIPERSPRMRLYLNEVDRVS